MSKNELVAKIEALNEWEAVIEEAKAEAEAIRDSIKAKMMERDTEELAAGKYIVRWTSVLSNRFQEGIRRSLQSLHQAEPEPPLYDQRLKKSPLREHRPK